MNKLALTLPGGQTISAGSTLPQGGLDIVKTVVGRTLTIFLIIGVMASLIFIIWGAMQWTSSGGDKSKVTAARSKITFAIVGLVVMLLSFGILAIMGRFFGVNLLQF